MAARVVEALVAIPVRAFRLFLSTILFNPRLGRLRFLVAPVIFYVVFALALVYVYAPIRGITGQVWMGEVLRYANERSLGTAIYDANARFVGIFDPILDSEEDFNYLGRPIRLPDYIAYPDHKSLHVSRAPEHYWQCLVLHEDRHLGGPLNPFGIDLYGVLKIPFSTLQRSLEAGRPRLGAGGSSLSMQLARIFFKTPPSADESAAQKLKRKLKEWWLAPVIYWELTKGGDREPLKLWAANHFPLAQRTGGQALSGVEQTSLILFGKGADALSAAETTVWRCRAPTSVDPMAATCDRLPAKRMLFAPG
jgi:membrane peptidoglycan carboxypeptidase